MRRLSRSARCRPRKLSRAGTGVLAAAVAGTLLLTDAAVAPATQAAAAKPVITSINVTNGATGPHTAETRGGQTMRIRGRNFVGVRYVVFGKTKGTKIRTVNSTTITVTIPKHVSGIADVRVITTAGWSSITHPDRVKYEVLGMSTTHLNGGLTATQERRISATFKAKQSKLRVGTAKNAHKWTADMARTAVNRARLYVGLSYSWAGGVYTGPSNGVCNSADAGIFDCHVWGFDCSGLVMYAWSKYKKMVHYAASQYGQAGKFHPTLDELQPGDLLFYSSNGTVSGIHHVAMYLGKGKVIQAPQSGSLVSINDMNTVIPDQYYGATRPMSTGRQGLPPRIISISAKRVPLTGGTKLTITGKRFNTASAVRIGTLRTRNFTIVNSDKIVVTLPAHTAGTVNVQVGNAWGLSPTSAGTQLTYTSPPRIAKLTAARQPVTGGRTVTISGIPFLDVTNVTIGGKAVKYGVVDGRTISATVPAHTAGNARVQVTTKYGATPDGSGATMQYVAAPTVSKISPIMVPLGGGQTVTVHGTNFVDVSKVTIGGVAATGVKVTGSTSLTAVLPAHAYGQLPVVVTTAYGTSNATTQIAYARPPEITGITQAGDTVTITGARFISPATVTFGSVAVTDVTGTDSTLTVKVPDGLHGDVPVTVTSPYGTSPAVTYTAR